MLTVELMSAPKQQNKGTDDTVTIGVNHETKRSLNTLKVWHECTVAEYCTETIDPILQDRIEKMMSVVASNEEEPEKETDKASARVSRHTAKMLRMLAN